MGEDKEVVSLALVLLGFRLWPWCSPGASEIQAAGKSKRLLLLAGTSLIRPPHPPSAAHWPCKICLGGQGHKTEAALEQVVSMSLARLGGQGPAKQSWASGGPQGP